MSVWAYDCWGSSCLITLHGLPAASGLARMSLFTTLPAPITQLSPMDTPSSSFRTSIHDGGSWLYRKHASLHAARSATSSGSLFCIIQLSLLALFFFGQFHVNFMSVLRHSLNRITSLNRILNNFFKLSEIRSKYSKMIAEIVNDCWNSKMSVAVPTDSGVPNDCWK